MAGLNSATVIAVQVVIMVMTGCVDIPPPRVAPVADMQATDGCLTEICNDVDDDCDGVIDEGFDFQTDPGHCGGCGNSCVAVNANSRCEAGECVVDACDDGFIDCDDSPGCETLCAPGGVEANLCNGVDEDCDCVIDEGVEVMDSVDNCGGCNIRCAAGFNAMAGCVERSCVIAACDPGFFNPDGKPETGCPCLQPAPIADDLPIALATFPEQIQVRYLGDGSDGMVVWNTGMVDGLTVEYRTIDTSGYWTSAPERLELERTPDTLLIDVVALGDGRYGVVWSSAGDLWFHRLGDPIEAARQLFDSCDLNARTCAYTVVEGDLVAVRLVRRMEGETDLTDVITSTGIELARGQVPFTNAYTIDGFACRTTNACLALITGDGENLFSVSQGANQLGNPAVRHFAPLQATADGYLMLRALRQDGQTNYTSLILSDTGAISRGPNALTLPGQTAEWTLTHDGADIYFFSRSQNEETHFIRLRADGTQASDPEPFPFLPDGFTKGETLYHAATGRILGFDGPVADGLPWPDVVGERTAVAGHADASDATLVFDSRNSDSLVRVDTEGVVSPPELLFVHREGPRPLVIERSGDTLFALLLESTHIFWAVYTGQAPITRHRIEMDAEEDTPLQVDAALMPWDDGVMTALTAVNSAEPPQSARLLLPVTQTATLPERLAFDLNVMGVEAAPALDGPGADRGALLVTNLRTPQSSRLRMYRIGADGQLGMPTDIDRLLAVTQGLHAVVYAPGSEHTFVILADQFEEAGCANALGVQAFDAALEPIHGGTPSVRDRMRVIEELGDACITGVRAAPNAGGGATITLMADAGFWLLNVNADGERMGPAQRWSIGSPYHDLDLWPQSHGAQAFWHRRRGVMRTTRLGCE